MAHDVCFRCAGEIDYTNYVTRLESVDCFNNQQARFVYAHTIIVMCCRVNGTKVPNLR